MRRVDRRSHDCRYFDGRKGTPAVSRQLVAGFQEKCGATICKDLKGIETGRVLCSCPECVRNAVLTLGEVLKLEEKV